MVVEYGRIWNDSMTIFSQKIETRKQAISFLKQCREIHELWVDHQKEYEKMGAPVEHVGGSDHHQNCVDRYTEAVSFFEETAETT